MIPRKRVSIHSYHDSTLYFGATPRVWLLNKKRTTPRYHLEKRVPTRQEPWHPARVPPALSLPSTPFALRTLSLLPSSLRLLQILIAKRRNRKALTKLWVSLLLILRPTSHIHGGTNDVKLVFQRRRRIYPLLLRPVHLPTAFPFDCIAELGVAYSDVLWPDALSFSWEG